jgi:hypothetical protein
MRFSLFLLFLPEIISQRAREIRRNPGPSTVPHTQKQRDCWLFFRCFPLFFV